LVETTTPLIECYHRRVAIVPCDDV